MTKVKEVKRKSLAVRAAYALGKKSVGRCIFWYNQPKIPQKMLKK